MTESLQEPGCVMVPRLFTVARAANLLGCSTRTVRRRIHDGQLPAVIEGERTMVRGDDLAAYIDSLKHTGHNAQRRRPRARARTYDFLAE